MPRGSGGNIDLPVSGKFASQSCAAKLILQFGNHPTHYQTWPSTGHAIGKVWIFFQRQLHISYIQMSHLWRSRALPLRKHKLSPKSQCWQQEFSSKHICRCLDVENRFPLAGCTTDIMTSDHSPVFASFEVGVASQFVSKQGTIPPKTHFVSIVPLLFCSTVKRSNSEPHPLFQIQTVRLKVGYRSWTAWPHCWQNPRPSSLWSTIPAAWRVCFFFRHDWEDHVGTGCLENDQTVCFSAKCLQKQSRHWRERTWSTQTGP